MRTILTTLTTGIFVCLITSIGMDTELDLYNSEYGTIESITEMELCNNCFNYIDDCIPDCELEVLEKKLFGNSTEFQVIQPNDINVIEVEEEIIIHNLKFKK